MSDMRSERLTIRLESSLRAQVRQRAKRLGIAESDLVRRAIERDTANDEPVESAYDVFHRLGLIGISDQGPSDLSTNKKHMEGFGRPRK